MLERHNSEFIQLVATKSEEFFLQAYFEAYYVRFRIILDYFSCYQFKSTIDKVLLKQVHYLRIKIIIKLI